MRRSAIADWCAGVLAIMVFALGGLVVVKPAVDHWNDLYRGDPYRAGNHDPDDQDARPPASRLSDDGHKEGVGVSPPSERSARAGCSSCAWRSWR